MANIKSAIKRIRQSAKRTEINKAERSRVRTFAKKVLTAVDSGNLESAQQALREANSVLAVAARKGIIPANQMSRKVSRLNAQVRKLAQAGAA
ncbi:MAG: 30S ribosomal protein S20 [Magnetococcus sp. WYHC-3]